MEKEYSRYMSNFRGIDSTSDASNVSLNRFSFIQNMYKDYKSGQGVAIETFPGTRTLCKGLGKIYGIHTYKVSSGKVHVIVHSGTKLYHFDSAERDNLNIKPAQFEGIVMNEAKSSSFVYNNRLYLIDGENYVVVYEAVNDEEKTLKAEHIDNSTAYVPTTFSNGAEYEQRNMLTSKFIEKSFLAKLEYDRGVIPAQKPNIVSGTSTIRPWIGGHEEYIRNNFTIYSPMCICGCGKAYEKQDEDDRTPGLGNYIHFKTFVSIAPSNAKEIKINFDEVSIDWTGCKSSLGDTTYFYKIKRNDKEVIVRSAERPSYHLDTSETISIDELRNRKNDKSIVDENGIYQYGFYENISDAYLDEANGEANRRSLLTSVKMYDNVKTITGTLSGCSNLKTILLSNSITELDGDFFSGTAITTAYLPYDLKSFKEANSGKKLFEGCTNLITIYASSRRNEDGVSIYSDLKNNPEKYGISSNVEIKSYEANFMSGVPNGTQSEGGRKGKNRVYIRTPCEKITSVYINEAEIPEMLEKLPENDNKDEITLLYAPVYEIINEKCHITAIDFYFEAYARIPLYEDEYYDEPEYYIFEETGKEINGTVEIWGEAHPSVFTTSGDAEKEADEVDTSGKDALSYHKNYSGDAFTAISHCKTCCAFDDRMFFTGNPELPNTVFYTQRDLTGHNNPTYVGVLNWFDDGMGNTRNVAMMSNASTLMVLKGNTLQDGSIYYHTGADGGNDLTPRIYPSVEGLAGLGCVGMAVNFRDDCVFMSNRGLEAIAKQTVNLERTIEHRSTNIDGLMLHSELASARAAEWEGYLCILIDGKMFLADSRQAFESIGGALEYEWYYVADVCGYDDDNKKYYLADYMPSEIADFCKAEGILISDSEDRRVHYKDADKNDGNDLVKSILFSETVDDITTKYTVYYVEQGSKKYLVESHGEMENGTPDMACEICAVEDILLFGTEGGKLLCLNNDKRGTNEYEEDKSRIPVEWYNNSGHAYISRAVLAMENAGVPHYTKTTVKRGTVLRLKSFEQSAFDLYATTDRQATSLLTRQSNSTTTFDSLDFDNLGLLTADSSILAIKEKTKKWVEKQYEFRNDKCNQPFGLYSITYRYTIAGDVKNK